MSLSEKALKDCKKISKETIINFPQNFIDYLNFSAENGYITSPNANRHIMLSICLIDFADKIGNGPFMKQVIEEAGEQIYQTVSRKYQDTLWKARFFLSPLQIIPENDPEFTLAWLRYLFNLPNADFDTIYKIHGNSNKPLFESVFSHLPQYYLPEDFL